MLIKTKGIVFRVVKYGETSVICDIYTEERGLQGYIINSVRTKKPKFHAGLLQIMSLVDMVAYAKDEKTLNHIKELRADVVYQTIPFDIKKSAIGMLMAELTQKTVKEAETNPVLFSFIYRSFIFLDQTKTACGNIHLWYAVQLTSLLGFLPDMRNDNTEQFFDLKEGIYTSAMPSHGLFLGAEHSALLEVFMNATLDECHLIPMTPPLRRSFLRGILQYYQLHVDNFTELKSLNVLQEVF